MTTRRSLVLDTTVRVVFDAALVLSLYLLFAGHNQPGGGFVGGLVAGSAYALRYIAKGLDEVRTLLPVQPWTVLSLGLVVAVGAALLPLAFGDGPLDQHAFEWHLPLLGKVKATTATVFDCGVYLVVVGLVLMVVDSLGPDDEPSDATESNEPTQVEP